MSKRNLLNGTSARAIQASQRLDLWEQAEVDAGLRTQEATRAERNKHLAIIAEKSSHAVP